MSARCIRTYLSVASAWFSVHERLFLKGMNEWLQGWARVKLTTSWSRKLELCAQSRADSLPTLGDYQNQKNSNASWSAHLALTNNCYFFSQEILRFVFLNFQRSWKIDSNQRLAIWNMRCGHLPDAQSHIFLNPWASAISIISYKPSEMPTQHRSNQRCFRANKHIIFLEVSPQQEAIQVDAPPPKC